MKKFKIAYTRHGQFGTYDHSQIIEARSEKMALKKFWNYRQFPQSNSNRENMEYERECNGIYWSEPTVVAL